MVAAGSLRIETFEGSRPRLRRTRQGYGRSIRPRAFRADELRSREALRAGARWLRPPFSEVACRRKPAVIFGVLLSPLPRLETHVGCACRSKRVFSAMMGQLRRVSRALPAGQIFATSVGE